jgi:hypothetical protein
MPARSVDEFLAALNHPRFSEIERLRELISAAAPRLVEHVKWNAPSYMLNGEDRVTMRLQPHNCVALILHRGAKVRDATDFVFEDRSGLAEWRTPDRGQIAFADLAEIDARAGNLADLLRDWLEVS